MIPERTTEQYIRCADQMYCEGRTQIALDYLMEALRVDSRCYEALVGVGELYVLRGAALGLDERAADIAALAMFDRAIALRPELAEAYAGKALTLLYLDEFDQAIQWADEGLLRLDHDATLAVRTEVKKNVGESLYRAKALALRESGQEEQGRQVLEEGLGRYPASEYLTQIVDRFLPSSPLTDQGLGST